MSQKIDRAVETCLAYAAGDRPFQQAAEILVVLRRNAGWSDMEKTEVQNAVLTKLIEQAWDRASGLSANGWLDGGLRKRLGIQDI